MTSLLTGLKQSNTDGGYFITVGSLLGKVYARTAEPTGNTGTNGGTFSTAQWAYFGSPGNALSSVVATGTVLKDMGRTVVSSLRTFRKVQLVVSNSGTSPTATSTFGVGGTATSNGDTYFTGYIELGLEGVGQPAPVARFGR